MHEETITRRPLKSRDTRWAKALAKWLTTAGFKPNHISLLSVACGMGAGAAFVGAGLTTAFWQVALFLTAAACIQLRLLCNLFDGMVAIEGGCKTKSGEIYNELPDRISDSAILIGAGYAMPAGEWLHTLGWLAALLSVLTAYIRALGVTAGAAPCFLGPMAKPHRMALLTATCVLMAVLMAIGKPVNLIHPALALLCAGGVITCARRVRTIIHELESA